MLFTRALPSLAAISFASLLAGSALAQAPQSSNRKANELYATFCASCHGPGLQGAAAPSLIDAEWKHGSDDESIIKSIRDGNPNTGMPPFGPMLSNRELRGLVVFIREQAGRAASASQPPPKPAADAVASSKLHRYRVADAIPGLSEPWSIAFLPDSRVLLTEKRGNLRVFENNKLGEPVSGIPKVDTGGQAGLFDVVPHPAFAENGWLYLAFSEPAKNEAGRNVAFTTVVRGRLKDNAWTDEQTIFRAQLESFRTSGGVHYGGRLAFDKAGFLFFSIGDRGQQAEAQNLDRPNGKVHRVHDDGRIPDDNPFVKNPAAVPSIWSYGHRNPQGLRFHPVTGELWSHEHGPRGGDELNLVKRGLNYGWPAATFGMNYNGTPVTDITGRPGIEPPAHYWVPSIAPCGMTFYTGDQFPKWQNHLFVSSLAGQELVRFELKDGKVADREIIFKGLGRMRDVIAGPDGLLYVLFPDRVAKLLPAD